MHEPPALALSTIDCTAGHSSASVLAAELSRHAAIDAEAARCAPLVEAASGQQATGRADDREPGAEQGRGRAAQVVVGVAQEGGHVGRAVQQRAVVGRELRDRASRTGRRAARPR